MGLESQITSNFSSRSLMWHFNSSLNDFTRSSSSLLKSFASCRADIFKSQLTQVQKTPSICEINSIYSSFICTHKPWYHFLHKRQLNLLELVINLFEQLAQLPSTSLSAIMERLWVHYDLPCRSIAASEENKLVFSVFRFFSHITNQMSFAPGTINQHSISEQMSFVTVIFKTFVTYAVLAFWKILEASEENKLIEVFYVFWGILQTGCVLPHCHKSTFHIGIKWVLWVLFTKHSWQTARCYFEKSLAKSCLSGELRKPARVV